MIKYGVGFVALGMLLAGCAETAPATSGAEPEIANVSPPLVLETKHTSVFSRVDYRIPKGWVVIDGESDWVAPSLDKHFWEPTFDPAKDAYYTVSAQPPFLTVDDFAEKRRRTFREFVSATHSALNTAANAKDVEALAYNQSENGDTATIFVSLGEDDYLYQVFVELPDGKVGTVAGRGPAAQLGTMKQVVRAIAETLEPHES